MMTRKSRMSEFSRGRLKVCMRSLGTYIGRYGRRLLLVCFEGRGSDSHRRFVRGSREISPASSLIL